MNAFICSVDVENIFTLKWSKDSQEDNAVKQKEKTLSSPVSERSPVAINREHLFFLSVTKVILSATLMLHLKLNMSIFHIAFIPSYFSISSRAFSTCVRKPWSSFFHFISILSSFSRNMYISAPIVKPQPRITSD